MFPKIPQLKRENASLRDPRQEDTPSPKEDKAGTNQKIPQTHPPHKGPTLRWYDQQKDPQPDCKEEEGHNASVETSERR